MAVWPAGAMRSIWAGTSTSRPAESVNVRVALSAAWSFLGASPPDAPSLPPPEQPANANASPRQSAQAASSRTRRVRFKVLVPSMFLPFLPFPFPGTYRRISRTGTQTRTLSP